MKFSKLISVIFSLTLFTNANAAIIGGDLLDTSGASQLEGYLGLGSLNFTNISNLSAGATSTQWHSDVAGYTNVISIYDITYGGTNYLIGGYSSIGHDNTGYSGNTSNFLFNLTENLFAGLNPTSPWTPYQQYDASNYFATFGAGHDLWGGLDSLGLYDGYVWDGFHPNQPSGTNGISYDFGGTRWFGSTSIYNTSFQVNGLESYVFDTASVPEPTTILLFSAGLLGLIGLSRRKTI